MKLNRLAILLLILPLLALWGCEGDEGPAGPAGTDGTDGTDGVDGIDGNVTCLECHATDAMNSISLQFDRSQHGLGEFVDYAGSRSYCANCHSGNGYIEWAETGGVDANFTTPDPINCRACHSVHDSFEAQDYALRKADAVTWIYNSETFDFEDNSNVCGWCHQSRRGEPEHTNPGEATFVITSTHWGPHHGAQANVWAAAGFAEITGSNTYPAANLHAGATCIDCHMAEYADGEGGHTFWPAIVSCTTCHPGLTDFDRNGFQTDMHDLLDELRDNLIAAGVIHEDPEEEGHYIPLLDDPDVDDADSDGNTTELFAYVTQTEARAFYNWIGLYEDRSLGIHNPSYVEALLENSIEATAPGK